MIYPSFVEDEKFLKIDTSIPERDQLRRMVDNLQRIHTLSCQEHNSFDDLIHTYIQAGIDIFGLETGIVSEITEGKTYRVCDVVSPFDGLEKDQIFPLADTYCREVFESQEVLGFPKVGALSYMACHPVYVNMKLESYLSAPIFVDGNLFGTLNFSSTAIREHGFSVHERNLISLMANAIGSFILLRDREEKLTTLNTRLKQFVAYVAHDLRNPLGGILSYAKLALAGDRSAEKLKTLIEKIVPPAEQALEFVSTILENAALNFGKIEVNKKPTSLDKLLADAVEGTAHLNREREVTITVPKATDIVVTCDYNRMRQVLVNLLVNALKYSPSGSTIEFKVKQEDNQCHLRLVNPVDHKEQQSAQTKYDSIGFGLDIVNDLLASHGSKLIIEEKDKAYTAAFSLALEQETAAVTTD